MFFITNSTMNVFFAVILCLSLAACALRSQEFVPGATYLGTDGYIEYQPGNIPLIISVPHGGRLEPANLPDRDCDGCSYVMDSYTQELAREIREAFVGQTGCYPHVIYNLLHRKKLDMNRNLITGTDSNAALDPYWNDYHRFINAAKDSILLQHGKGLFIDLHGHGHTKQRIEYGYLLYESQLRETDSVMNSPERVKVSSIRSLSATNRNTYTHAQLVRGDQALGTLFANDGFPGVPSKQDPYPLVDDLYFNGGYNTLVHGSNPGGTIDAIQLELYSAIRFNTAQRAAFAKNFAIVLRKYLQVHYFDGFAQKTCQSTSVGQLHAEDVYVAPNPATDYLTVQGMNPSANPYKLVLIDMVGRIVHVQMFAESSMQIDIRHLEQGSYGVYLNNPGGQPIYRGCVVVVR